MDSNERKGYLGGSEAASALGLSRWKTMLTLWGEKTGQIEPEDISDKMPVRVGTKMEQSVVELFCEETGKKVRRVNDLLVHKDHDFIVAHIDRRIVGEDAILEAKTCSAYKAREWSGEEIPQEYILQCYHYLAVTGAAKCYLAVLIGNTDFKIKEIMRNEKIQGDIIAREVDFWQNYVVPKVMPLVISKDDGGALRDLFPEESDNIELILTPDNERLIENLQALKADAISLEGNIKKLENELKAIIKDAKCAQSERFKVTWKPQVRTSVDGDKLKKEFPDVSAQCEKKTNMRVLRITTLTKENVS